MPAVFAFLLFLAGSAGTAETVPQTPPRHYVLGCGILDREFKPIRQFPGGECLFLDDGSYITRSGANKWGPLSRIGVDGGILWRRNTAAHHFMTLSPDRKRLLTLEQEIHDDPLCRIRVDIFSVLDIRTGKPLLRYSSWDHKKELFRAARKLHFRMLRHEAGAPDMGDCQYTHFNSIYEIPPNPSSNANPAFAPGNYIVSLNGMGIFAILDARLEKIIWTMTDDISPESFHDVQVLETGQLLTYENESSGPPGGRPRMEIRLFDPIRNKTDWRFLGDDADRFAAPGHGGVQALDEGFLFSVNDRQAAGYIYLVSRDGKVMRSLPNPFHGASDPRPAAISYIKAWDLRSFLSRNRF